MKKLILAIVVLLGLSIQVAEAQNISGTTCTQVTQTGCLVIPVQGQGSIGIQITGTWAGTITFRGSVNGTRTNDAALLVVPSGSSTAVSTTIANGLWMANVAGLREVIVVFTVYSSGTAVVTRVTTSVRGGASGSTGGGGGGGSGTVTSVGLTGPDLFTFGSAVTTSGDLSFTPTDPAADRIVFWDDSASKLQYLTAGTGLTITGTTMTAAGGSPGGSDTQVQYNDAGAFGGDAGLVYDETANSLKTTGSVLVGTTPADVTDAADAGSLLVGDDAYTCGAPTYSCAPWQLSQTFTSGANFTGAFESVTVFTPDGDSAGVTPYLFSTTFSGTNSVGTSTAYTFGSIHSTTDTSTAVTGTTIGLSVADGTVTTAKALAISPALDDHTTNWYSLYIADAEAGAATLEYAIFYDGASAADFSVDATAKVSATRYAAAGSSPTVDDTTGGNSCGASGNPSMVSGSTDNAWEFNVGAGGGTSCTITFATTAPNKWICSPNNQTTGNLVRANSATSTTIVIVGVLTAADIITGVCFAR